MLALQNTKQKLLSSSESSNDSENRDMAITVSSSIQQNIEIEVEENRATMVSNLLPIDQG